MGLPFRGLAIRLAKHGCTNRPFYHIIVMPTHKGRDHHPIEQIGTYDPMVNDNNERLVAVNFDRFKHWMAKGAKPTKPVQKLIGLSGFLPLHPMTFITAKRNNAKRADLEAQQAEQQQETEAQQTL